MEEVGKALKYRIEQNRTEQEIGQDGIEQNRWNRIEQNRIGIEQKYNITYRQQVKENRFGDKVYSYKVLTSNYILLTFVFVEHVV